MKKNSIWIRTINSTELAVAHPSLCKKPNYKMIQGSIGSQYKWNAEQHEWPWRMLYVYSCQSVYFSHKPGSVTP